MSVAIVTVISIAVLGLKAFLLAKLADRELQELGAIRCPICRSNVQTVAAFRSLWTTVKRSATRSGTEIYSSSETRPSVAR